MILKGFFNLGPCRTSIIYPIILDNLPIDLLYVADNLGEKSSQKGGGRIFMCLPDAFSSVLETIEFLPKKVFNRDKYMLDLLALITQVGEGE